jgi:uncharacterized protein
MKERIWIDKERFERKQEKLVQEGLERFLYTDKMRIDDGKGIVEVDIPRIDIPHFKYGANQGGVGMGKEGEEGDSVGDDTEEMEKKTIPFPRLLDMMIEKWQLDLPELEPSPQKVTQEKIKYTKVRQYGPRALLHKRRTLKNALLRSISQGTYVPGGPLPIEKDDMEYRSFQRIQEPLKDVSMIFLMDSSSSMTKEYLDYIRKEVYWLPRLLSRMHENQNGTPLEIGCRYVLHTDVAYEAENEEDFLTTGWGGSTLVSKGLTLCKEIIEEEKSKGVKNFLLLQYSDGDYEHGDRDRIVNATDDVYELSKLFTYTQIAFEKDKKDGGLYTLLRNEFKKEVKSRKMRLHYVVADSTKHLKESIRKKFGKK